MRDPTPRTLILGLAASTLIAFSFLTQMHERYVFGAVIFLLLLIPERRIQWLYLVFSVVFMLNLWSAIPPAPVFRDWLPYPGLQSIVGAVVMIAITLVSTCGWDRGPGEAQVPALRMFERRSRTGPRRHSRQDLRVQAAAVVTGYSPAGTARLETRPISTAAAVTRTATRRPDLPDAVVVVGAVVAFATLLWLGRGPDVLRRRVGGHGGAHDHASTAFSSRSTSTGSGSRPSSTG